MSQKKINLMNLQSLIIQKSSFYKQANIKIKEENKTVWPTLGQTVLFFYKYDYTMEQAHLIFLVLMLQDQYNLEVFFATVKDKVVFGFR